MHPAFRSTPYSFLHLHAACVTLFASCLSWPWFWHGEKITYNPEVQDNILSISFHFRLSLVIFWYICVPIWMPRTYVSGDGKCAFSNNVENITEIIGYYVFKFRFDFWLFVRQFVTCVFVPPLLDLRYPVEERRVRALGINAMLN